MTIRKQGDKYFVDVRPQGAKGKRFRRKFDTQHEARQYEKYILANFHDKEWLKKPAEKRPLTELIKLWWRYAGQGKKTADNYLHKLKQIDRELGYPTADQITHKLLSKYRAYHLDKSKAITTFNRKITCLSNVFTVLIEAQEYHNPHPLKGFKLTRPRAREMHFLSLSEIETLLSNLSGDALQIAQLCLATGARWGEAQMLKGSQVVQGRVTFLDTKNGKNRTVPITPELEQTLPHSTQGRLFANCYREFYKALKQCNFYLPKGQAAHVLRHTFASHFMMNGGNILALQRILGHATIQQTMNYAHLAPDYLIDAIKFNPLKKVHDQQTGQ
ncbi:phage integrase, partial [Vibrio coralliilyticus]|uniref:phage integrase n=1 Tax=Vibrio coralliilyticus TaxID=190893 RepID=UPI00183B22DA